MGNVLEFYHDRIVFDSVLTRRKADSFREPSLIFNRKVLSRVISMLIWCSAFGEVLKLKCPGRLSNYPSTEFLWVWCINIVKSTFVHFKCYPFRNTRRGLLEFHSMDRQDTFTLLLNEKGVAWIFQEISS